MAKYNIGDVMPDYSVSDPQGEHSTLSQQMGERGLLIFVLRGTWCPSCITQIHTVKQRYPRYQEQGVNAVFIMAEDPQAVWTFRMSQAQPLPFGLHADSQRQTIDHLLHEEQIGETPVVYLLDEHRRVVWRYVGKDAADRPGHTTLMTAIREQLNESSNAA